MGIPSDHLIERLKRCEGFRAEPYVCPAGKATIGYGHNLEASPSPIRLWSANIAELAASSGLAGRELVDRLKHVNMIWTKEHAEEWLRKDVGVVMARLSAASSEYRRLRALLAVGPDGQDGQDMQQGQHSQHGKVRQDGKAGQDARRAQVRLEVLIDMGFNMGVAGLMGFKRMFAAMANSDYDRAASEMMNSKWASQVGGRAVELAREMRQGTREGVSL